MSKILCESFKRKVLILFEFGSLETREEFKIESRADLARHLGEERPRITELLNGIRKDTRNEPAGNVRPEQMSKLVALYRAISKQDIDEAKATALWRDHGHEMFRECLKETAAGSVFGLMTESSRGLIVTAQLVAARKQMISMGEDIEDADLVVGPGDRFHLDVDARARHRLVCMAETGSERSVLIPSDAFDGKVVSNPQRLTGSTPWSIHTGYGTHRIVVIEVPKDAPVNVRAGVFDHSVDQQLERVLRQPDWEGRWRWGECRVFYDPDKYASLNDVPTP